MAETQSPGADSSGSSTISSALPKFALTLHWRRLVNTLELSSTLFDRVVLSLLALLAHLSNRKEAKVLRKTHSTSLDWSGHRVVACHVTFANENKPTRQRACAYLLFFTLTTPRQHEPLSCCDLCSLLRLRCVCYCRCYPNSRGSSEDRRCGRNLDERGNHNN